MQFNTRFAMEISSKFFIGQFSRVNIENCLVGIIGGKI